MVALRKRIQLLKCIFHMGNLLNAVSNDLPEIFLKILADDKNNLIKSGCQRVMDRIIHNDFSSRTYRFELLDTSAKPASDSGCHNNQCCVSHSHSLSKLSDVSRRHIPASDHNVSKIYHTPRQITIFRKQFRPAKYRF